MVVTLRNLSPQLEKRLREKARQNKASMARTVIGLLEETLGLRGSTPVEHHDLDWLAGSWTAGEAGEFDQSLREQRTTEMELWQ